jgi:hypothetical protein
MGNRVADAATAFPAQNAVAPLPHRRGPTCQATKKADGSPCTANATARSGFTRCPFHEDIPEELKQVWRAKGHAVIAREMTVPGAPDPQLADPTSVTRFVQETSGRLLRGEITASTAVALTALAKAALSAYEANLGAKLADLEALVAERQLAGHPLRVLGAPAAALPASREVR